MKVLFGCRKREKEVSKKLKIRASSFSFLKSNLNRIRHVRTEQSFDETWIFMGKS